jgi:hypothetical protein
MGFSRGTGAQRSAVSRIIKSVGHGLFAAGAVLSGLYFCGLYLKGSGSLRDALNPLTLSNYLALAPLLPGVFLLWVGDYATRRRGSPRASQ